MSDLTASEAASALEELRRMAEEANVAQRSAYTALELVNRGLEALNERGFQSGRMGSTMILASEATESASDNMARTFSLMQGIQEMI